MFPDVISRLFQGLNAAYHLRTQIELKNQSDWRSGLCSAVLVRVNDLNKQRRGKGHNHAQITRDRNELEKEAWRRLPLIKATGIRTQFCGLEFIFYPEEVEVLIFDKNFFCHIFPAHYPKGYRDNFNSGLFRF